MTLPNLITLGRLLAVPLVVWLVITDRYLEAAIIFVLAGISDAVDGFIAKRFGSTSVLGAYLDPLADKTLLVSIFLTLGFKGVLPPWLIVAVVSRDILIVGAVILSWMLNNPVAVKPILISKLNTTSQIILVGLALFMKAGLIAIAPLMGVMTWITGLLTAASAAAYLSGWFRHMAAGETGEEEQEK